MATKTKQKDCCYECMKQLAISDDTPLYSVSLSLKDTFISLMYCEECFRSMAGKKHINMMHNYMEHYISEGDMDLPGTYCNYMLRSVPPVQKTKRKFKNILATIIQNWELPLAGILLCTLFLWAIHAILGQ